MKRPLAVSLVALSLACLAPAGLLWAQKPAEEPSPLDPIVVTAGRVEQRLAEAPASVTVLTEDDVKASAAQTVDDLLRQVPGFSLFRRSSSLVTHPTAQGVSLRGLGAAGSSRALVLVDGVPLNDPFGGWVHWGRVPRLSIDRIEVVRGGGSSVWGNYALGGVVNILTRRPEGRVALFDTTVGSHGTSNLEFLLGEVAGGFRATLVGSLFETDGFKVIKRAQRGAIDVEADSAHTVLDGRLEYQLTPGTSVFLAGSYFTEDRGNGTPLTSNATESRQLVGGARFRAADGSDWTLTLFSHVQTFESSFSSQAANRKSEIRSLDQKVPSTSVGGSLQWTRRLGDHRLAAGMDLRWIDGETDEDVYASSTGVFLRKRVAGGEQFLTGLWGQDLVALAPGWELAVGLRADWWQSFDGARTDTPPPAGVAAAQQFGDRDALALSPRAALLYHPSPATTLRTSVYQGFRAPTVNELYRVFRVRNDVTAANAKLDPERLTGGEVGVQHAVGGRLGLRLTGFWNEVADPIANVSLPARSLPDCHAGTTCRQRQNLDRTRILGLEPEVTWRPAAGWELLASHLVTDTEVLEASRQRSLEGKRIAQVPRNQSTVGVRWSHPAIANVALQGRWVDEQYEDDLNTLKLGDLFVVDVQLSRQVTRWGEVSLGIQNLFDRTYPVGKTADGIVTTGTPRLVHAGVKLRF